MIAHEVPSLEGWLPPRLAAAVVAVHARLAPTGTAWWLTGGCALRLQGGRNRPRDLDLECAARDVGAVAAALGLAARRDDAGRVASLRATGGVGGVEVDLSAGLEVRGPHRLLPPDDGLVRAGCAVRRVAGREVLCAPPEEALVRALVAGDWGRVARLAVAVPPPPRADYVLRRLASSRAAR